MHQLVLLHCALLLLHKVNKLYLKDFEDCEAQLLFDTLGEYMIACTRLSQCVCIQYFGFVQGQQGLKIVFLTTS